MTKRKLAVVIVLAAALGLRLWRLDSGDITPDENHYIHDAERWWQGDPYVSVRHHPFLHGQPNMGHPFLGQALIGTAFRLLGNSVWVARLVSVIAGMVTIGLLLRFNLVAAVIYTIAPLAVRFNRTAYLDSLMALWILALGGSIWGSRWIVAGVMIGLAISTKLSGILALGVAIILWWRQRGSVKDLGLMIGMGLAIGYLLNDPASYTNGIVHPADSEFVVLQPDYWITGIRLWLNRVGNASWFLLGPVFTGAVVWSLLSRTKDKWGKFLRWWLVGVLGFVWLQPKSEYAWLPLLPVLALIVGQVVGKRWQVGMLIGLTLPWTIMFGLRLVKLPYIRSDHTYNRTINDDFYKTVLQKVNDIALKKSQVLFLPQEGYPMFALRKDVSWAYYGDADTFDVLVVDENVAIENGQLVTTVTGQQDGQSLSRKIYQRR